MTEDAVRQLDIDGAGGDLDSDALALIGSPLVLTAIAGLAMTRLTVSLRQRPLTHEITGFLIG